MKIFFSTHNIDLYKGTHLSSVWLRACGFWQRRTPGQAAWVLRLQKLLAFLTVFSFLACLPLVIMDSLLIRASGNSSITTTHLVIMVSMFTIFQNMVVLFYYQSDLQNLLSSLKDIVVPYFLESRLCECKRMCEKITNLSMIFSSMLVLTIPFGLINYFTDNNDEKTDDNISILHIWQPKNKILVFVLLGLRSISSMLALCSYVGIRCLYLSLAEIIGRLLDHLNDVMADFHGFYQPFERLRPQASLLDKTYQQHTRQVLIYCIRHHQKIIKVIEDMNRIFSMVKLVDVWTCLFVFCATAFQFTLANQQFVETSILALAVMNNVVYLSLLCWGANEITLKGLKMKQCCSTVAFWNWQESNRSLLDTMAIRVNSPLYLIASQFYVLSLDTLKAVFGISLSYCVFLYQYRNSNE